MKTGTFASDQVCLVTPPRVSAPWTRVTSIPTSYHYRSVLPGFDYYINGIEQYVLYCVWLLSHNIMFVFLLFLYPNEPSEALGLHPLLKYRYFPPSIPSLLYAPEQCNRRPWFSTAKSQICIDPVRAPAAYRNSFLRFILSLQAHCPAPRALSMSQLNSYNS